MSTGGRGHWDQTRLPLLRSLEFIGSVKPVHKCHAPCRSCPCPHKALNASNPGATQLSITPFMAQTQFLPAAKGESRVPDLSMSQNHLRGLVKAQTAGPPTSKFLIQQIGDDLRFLPFLQVPRCCCCCKSRGHSLRTAGNEIGVLRS